MPNINDKANFRVMRETTHGEFAVSKLDDLIKLMRETWLKA
jgi:hypothetical protein